jgi:hypothetical protein
MQRVMNLYVNYVTHEVRAGAAGWACGPPRSATAISARRVSRSDGRRILAVGKNDSYLLT